MRTTRDDFLGGRIALLQPEKGFRAGLDTVLLAAAVSGRSSRVLELGAGSGVASCCVLADLPGAEATLVDVDADMLELARRNVVSCRFENRAVLLELDVREKGAVRAAAGLRPDHFSTVIANPPFFDAAGGTASPSPCRARARHMPSGELDVWVKTAATSLAPGGEVIFIHAASVLPDLLAAFGRRFGAISLLPLVPRAGQPANRILLRGIKGSRAPFSLLSPLVLYRDGEQGGYLPQIDAILRGRDRLHW